ncbi:MAG: Uma2 family endonuclease [Microcoleus sp. SIO2G3]|nr:Uma2 family endonuclease [Microcoleus sp. SIO2G3]
MTLVFGAPAASALDDLNFSQQQNWAVNAQFESDTPPLLSRRNRKRAEVKESVEMAFFQLEQQGKRPGRSIGSGSFVNRLGQDALMPDVMFFCDRGRNSLYDYYLEGPAEIVVEFITPGCEVHDLEVKRSRYQAAGVPELWTIDCEQETVHFQRWVEGAY